MSFTFPIRINGQVYSYRDIRCDGDPRLGRIAQGMASMTYSNQAEATHFFGVHQGANGIIPGGVKPNFGMSLRKEEWDYLFISGVLPPLGYSDHRLDFSISYGQSEAGGISRMALTNFHLLGPSGNWKMGDAIILDIACIVESIAEDPGNGVFCSPVYPRPLL